jgi:hypothetical protein
MAQLTQPQQQTGATWSVTGGGDSHRNGLQRQRAYTADTDDGEALFIHAGRGPECARFRKIKVKTRAKQSECIDERTPFS